MNASHGLISVYLRSSAAHWFDFSENWKLETGNLKLETWNSQLTTRNSQPTTRNSPPNCRRSMTFAPFRSSGLGM
jgi:hypothetical protein